MFLICFLEFIGSYIQTKSGDEKYHRRDEKLGLTSRQAREAVFTAGSPVIRGRVAGHFATGQGNPCSAVAVELRE
jgi:hypothetical protein